MALRSNGRHSQLFTLRVWVEQTDGSHSEWRGKVQRVPSGETLYFRDWNAMEAFLLENLGGRPENDQGGKKEMGKGVSAGQ